MKIIIFLFGCLLTSCSLKKVTEVKISNENDFPITLTVKANNSSQIFTNIKPRSIFTGMFDWTNIEKKDGQWIFFVKNENSGGIDSFSHGYFIKGELYNYVNLIYEGSQLKVHISE